MPSWMNIDCNDNTAKIKGLESEIRDLERELDHAIREKDSCKYKEHISDAERLICRIQEKIYRIESEIRCLY